MEQYSVDDLKQIPDIASYPLPKALYKELGLPLPTIPTLREYLVSYQTALFHPSTEPAETRPPAEGGLREMPVEETKQECHQQECPTALPQPQES